MNYKIVKYSEIGKIRSGKRLPKGYTVSEKISDNKYIRVRDINNGSIDSSIVQYITDEAAEKLEISHSTFYRRCKERMIMKI